MNDRKDRIRVQIEEKEYSVVGGSFQDMLAAVKQITGRRFVSALKVWQLPGALETIQNQLDISGFRLEGGSPVAEAAPPTRSPAARGDDRIKVRIEGRDLAVTGGAFQDMLAAVKSLPGRRFDGNTKTWEISGDLSVIRQLIETAGFQLAGSETAPAAARPVAPSSPAMHVEEDLFEEPDFFADDEAPPNEPPDWWDDDNAPPPAEPLDWWAEADEAPSPASSGRTKPAAPAAARRQGGDSIRLRRGDALLVVSGGAFQAMLEVVKQIPGRRFDGQEKIWEIPTSVSLEAVRQQFEAAGFSLAQETGDPS